MATPGDPLYDERFYDEISAWARTSAAVVVPLVQEWTGATSVVDVGCGIGTWLAAWRDAGVTDVLGLDGSHVSPWQLAIPAGSFRSTDLDAVAAQHADRRHPQDNPGSPVVERSFDLAVSLEVAEHLDPSSALGFVRFLTSLAPVVLFSAAVPGQGGVGHVNEQWPAYWADHFAACGYRPADILRPRLWDHPDVAFFYAQNLLLFATDDRFDHITPALPTDLGGAGAAPLALVHPGLLTALQDQHDRPRPPASLSSVARQLPGAGLRAARRAARPIKRRVRGPATPGLPPTDWSVIDAGPEMPDVLDTFRLFAVLGTWNEADVVAATVRNAFRQGCERVYLVDNDSPDDTVAQAEAAGAVLARRFSTDVYDEALRMRLMNEVVAEVSAATAQEEGAEHIWWLWLDADEFHHGPAGRTVAEHLATLDRRFRVVGSRFFNHYPDRAARYDPARHPLAQQPLCEEQVYPMCAAGHRKHPLQRWDRDAAPITCLPGFHQARCATGPLLEPTAPIFLHHFPFRDEAVSRARLDLLCAGERASRDGEESWHIHKRHRSLDAVYRQDWAHVETLDTGRPTTGIAPRPWPDLVDPADAAVPTW